MSDEKKLPAERESELARLRNEVQDAHRALSDAGVPRQSGEVDISLNGRIADLVRSYRIEKGETK